MALVIKYGSGRFAPIILCDRCGELIQDDGNVIYDPNQSGRGAPLEFVHKACDRPRSDAGRDNWEPLETFFNHLLHNARIDTTRHDHTDCEML